MTDGKPSGQWASEVYDFLRLFQRYNSELWGLIIVQFIWAVLCVFLKDLSQTDTSPIITIPYVNSFNPLLMSSLSLRLTSVYTVGAAIIVFWWLFASGTYLFIYFPLSNYTSKLLSMAIKVLILLLLIPFTLIEILIYFVYELLNNFDIIKENFSNSASTEYKIGNVSDWLWFFYHRLVMLSNIKIGVASLAGYSAEEELNAAKLPSQIFAGAAGRIQGAKPSNSKHKKIKFVFLPSIVRATSPDRAKFLKRLLGLDVVLWGSYISTEPPTIWINLEQSWKNTRNSEDGTTILRDQSNAFPDEIVLENPIIVINQNDLLDTYITLMLVTVLSQKSMYPRIPSVKNGHRVNTFFGGIILRHIKRFTSISPYDYYMVHILFSINQLTDSESALYPNAKNVLVNLVSDWVAVQLRLENRKFNNEVNYLKNVLDKCIELDSKNCFHHYRIAAIECALGNINKAKESVLKGASFDPLKTWKLSNDFFLALSKQLSELEESDIDNNLKLSIIAIDIARVIQFFQDDARIFFYNILSNHKIYEKAKREYGQLPSTKDSKKYLVLEYMCEMVRLPLK